MPLVMGIDIGTSGCKTVLVDHDGTVVASAFAEYPLYSERHGWSEQDPADWWNAVKDTIRLVLAARPGAAKELIGIGLTGQMHGLVALDHEHQVLRRSILWNDSRTGPQCAKIIEKAGGLEGLLAITNNQMLPGYTGGKILWLAEKEPETHKRMRYFANPKDYIRLELTGELATEVSDASGTGMFNVAGRKWAPELFDIVGLPAESAPKAYESTETTGLLREAVATELGLPPGLPVVGGGGDAVIQTLGTGVMSSDVLMTTIGTSGIVSTALDDFKPNPGGRIQVFCNVIPGTWHAMGVTLSAGASLKWARELFGSAEEEVARALGEDVYDLISREVEKSPIGSRGVFFLPYINGERCPYSDPHARGAFIGLTLGTRKGDLYRSVMEGVTMSLRDAGTIFGDMGTSFDLIRTSGGGAQSEIWRQIHADIFRRPVETLSGSREGAAYGAAMVAGVGLELWSGFDEIVGLLTVETVTAASNDAADRYDRLFPIYQSYYGLLKAGFDRIAALEA